MRVGRALAAATLLLLPFLGGVALADTGVLDVGWWTNSPFAEAPDGGLAVGNAPNGPSTVGAVRLQVGRGVSSATLTLEEDGGFAHEVAVIQVCRAADAWSAEPGGELDDAPAHTCGTTAVLLEKGDGDTWSADVTSLVADAAGTATVKLLPGPGGDPTGTLGLGWEVRFAAPTFQATEVGAANDPPQATAPTTTPTTRPSVAPGSSSPRRAPAATSAPTTAVTTTTEPELQSDDANDAPVLAAPGASGDEGRPWGKFGGYLVVASLVGAIAGGGRWLVDSGVISKLPLPFR